MRGFIECPITNLLQSCSPKSENTGFQCFRNTSCKDSPHTHTVSIGGKRERLIERGALM
jgi:hypothetical protein